MTRRNGRALGVAVGLLVSVLAVAACGSSSNKSSSSSSGGPSSSSSPSANTSSSSSSSSSSSLSQAASYYAGYTHGGAGKVASGSPVSIGYFDDIGGAPSFPDDKVSTDAAVQFVNNELGGVGGHPIKLVSCFVSTSEQQGQQCAQQFLAAKVPVIVEGTAVLGAQAFHSGLNGAIPVIVGDPANPADATSKNAYGLTAGAFGTIPSEVGAAAVLKAKTASLLFPSDDPTGAALAGLFAKATTAAHISLTKAGYQTTSPDLLPDVIAAKSTSTDATMTLFGAMPACIAGAKAFKAANDTKPVISLGDCIAAPVKAGLGDYPQWYYANLLEIPNGPNLDTATKSFVQVMTHYAGANSNMGELPAIAWVGVLAATRALNLAGGPSASTSAVATQLKNYKGPTPMGSPTVTYGSIPGFPGVPNLQEELWQYHGNGAWTALAGGKWIGVP